VRRVSGSLIVADTGPGPPEELRAAYCSWLLGRHPILVLSSALPYIGRNWLSALGEAFRAFDLGHVTAPGQLEKVA
jgi:hypothetical protein